MPCVWMPQVSFGQAEVEAVTVTKKGRGLTVSMPQSVHASAGISNLQFHSFCASLE